MNYSQPLMFPFDDAAAVEGLAPQSLAVPLPDVRIEMAHRDMGWWSVVGEAGGGNVYRVGDMYAASSTDVRVFVSPWTTIGGTAATPLDAVRLAQMRQIRVAAALRPVIAAVNDRSASIFTVDGNSYWLRRDDAEYSEYFSWDKSVALGRSYLGAFVQSNLSAAKRAMFAFCRSFPELRLGVYYRTQHYEIYRQGEYIHFRLPFHDHGGEKSWISRDGRTAVKVDED